MSAQIDISVVIVSYKVKDLVSKCIESLFLYTDKAIKLEVILIDNASEDGTLELISEKFPQVKLIANKENKGFPAANNQGFEKASGKYILMLNPDTEFFNDAIRKIFNRIESDKDLWMIAPKLLNTDKSRQQSVWRFPKVRDVFYETHYMHSALGTKNYRDKDFNQAFEADSFSGAAILFRKELLKKIGKLDETMFWIEDVEFCYRASQAGLKRLYFPDAEIIHHIGQSAKKNYNISILNQVVNKIKFFRKHGTKWQHFSVVCLSFYHVKLKLLVFGLLSPFKKIYRLKAKAYWFTLFKVFNPPKGIS